MASFNRVIIVGNLTRDPEYKQLASGQATSRLPIASNRQYKNKQTGAMVQEVCYIDVDVWGAQAESCRQYLQKGRAVLIEGRLKFDSWKDNDGQTRSKHSVVADRVVFLSSPAAGDIASSDMEEERVVPKNQMERDLLDQLDEVKSRAESMDKKPVKRAAPAAKKKSEFANDMADGGMFKDEMDFKDEPPFQDDLPF